MNPCDENVVKTLRYLDHDLKGEELKDFRSHLQSCADCRAHLKAEEALSEALKRSRPLYSAPQALRDRLAAIHPSLAIRTQDPPYRLASRILGQRLPGTLERLSHWRVLAPAAVALALCLVVAPNLVRHAQAASFVAAAVETHRNYLDGVLPSGLESSSPEAVTAWFDGRVPFAFRLPASGSGPERVPVYRLTGGTVVNYKGRPAALVTYRAQRDRISLLVDSTQSAIVAGGEQVRFGKLTFHYHNNSGYRVITWSNHGLSYALVSSVSGPARASCLVCHENMADSAGFKAHQ